MVAYRIRYKIRSKRFAAPANVEDRLAQWTDWQDTERVVVVKEDAIEAVEEIKQRDSSVNSELMVTGIENISKIDIVARELTAK